MSEPEQFQANVTAPRTLTLGKDLTFFYLLAIFSAMVKLSLTNCKSYCREISAGKRNFEVLPNLLQCHLNCVSIVTDGTNIVSA